MFYILLKCYYIKNGGDFMIYPKDKISIIDGNVSAFDEICNWYTFLNKEDITYVKSKFNNLHYAFDCKLVK